MNPDLQAKLVTYLDGLEKGAAKVGEFAEREIPETIREWLLWLAIERFTYAAAFLVVALVVYYVARWAARLAEDSAIEDHKKKPENHQKEYAPDLGAALIFRGFQVVVPTLLMFGVGYWTLNGVKVLVAPRVVIVEKVAELAKGGAK